ncbi:hypothetical protein RHI49_20290 [Clostridioides difficile]|nr:hypothetical protein [Clostridioides difficile]
MNFRNIYLILMGLGIIILTTIISLIEIKIGFCNEKYFNKLESKYGNIDRKRTIKLEVLYRYVTGFEYIAIGILIYKKIRYYNNSNNISSYYNSNIILLS